MFLFLLSWAIYQSYWAVFLLGRGVSPQDVGLAVTAGLLARSVSVAVLFPLANRSADLLTILRVLPWLAVACAAVFLPHGSVGLLVVAAVALGMTYPVIQPALETMATLAAARGLLSYGPTRLLGTLGFVVGTFVAGGLLTVWGSEALLWAFIVACVLIGALMLLPTGETAVGGQRSGSGRDWAALFRRRRVVVMLLVMTALHASHAAYYTFGAVRFAELGASPTVVSALLVLAPAAEIVVLWLAPRFELGLSVRLMLVIALVAAAVRWLVLGLAGSLVVAALTQPLHGLTFAIAQVAFVRFLTEQVPPELTGAVQGMVMALALGLGTAVMTAVAGVLWDRSVLVVFAVMAAVALAGLPLLTDRALGRSRGNVPARGR
ncbi:MFS transporter, PPP family, 3-phenylpropionic acid transporter [Raineyella antarctica]|uniref:MFS transporter, PPP family, 3-phenylpropionic acid transporter n=2 Tax=Raineyella antarctica TaxID=1577474 RepID=A0A1G6GF88_9ACTN|nr:MFS transporter, PPP family, 3-phenylpropionic acid transporter [Raineyella antarctica]